jgi:hypothetical protein
MPGIICGFLIVLPRWVWRSLVGSEA